MWRRPPVSPCRSPKYWMSRHCRRSPRWSLPAPHLYSAVCREGWPGAMATEVSEVIPEAEIVNSAGDRGVLGEVSSGAMATEVSSESDDELMAPL